MLLLNFIFPNHLLAGQAVSNISSSPFEDQELEDPKNFSFRKKFFGAKNTFDFIYLGTLINLQKIYEYQWKAGKYKQVDHLNFIIQRNLKLGCFLESIKDLRELELSHFQSCMATFLPCLSHIEQGFCFEKLRHLVLSYPGYDAYSFKLRDQHTEPESQDFYLLAQYFLARTPALKKLTIKDRYPHVALQQLARSPHTQKIESLYINCRGKESLTDQDFTLILNSPYFKNLKNLSVAGYIISQVTYDALVERFGDSLTLEKFFSY